MHTHHHDNTGMANSKPMLPRTVGALAIAGLWSAAATLLPAYAVAQQVSMPCQVRAAGVMLNPSNHVLQYQGACKNGFAQGEGKAEWRFAGAPDVAPVVWQGRFDNGILLMPKAVLGAKPRDSSNMLLDLGPLADSAGKGGRLWVESSFDNKLPADACRPKALHVLVDVHAALASEQEARQWLQAAYRHWQRACPQGHANPNQPGQPTALAKLQIYQGFELTPDANGNLPPVMVSAMASLQGKDLSLRSYTNNAATLQQQKASQADQVKEYAANADRLQAMARQYGAKQAVDLQGLDKNPFRFDGQVLLVGVKPVRVLSRTSATVRPSHRDGWDFTLALAEGSDVAKWGEDSRMLAVKVKGRSTDVRTQDRVILEVLGSQACAISDCQDYLLHPGGAWAHDKVLP